jgi:hypothetical protein
MRCRRALPLPLFAQAGLSPAGTRFILYRSVSETLIFFQEGIDFGPELIVFPLKGHDSSICIVEIVVKSGNLIVILFKALLIGPINVVVEFPF